MVITLSGTSNAGGPQCDRRAASRTESCSYRTSARSLSPTRLSECGRCTSLRRIERTHEADMVTVGILDHSVADDDVQQVEHRLLVGQEPQCDGTGGPKRTLLRITVGWV
jgi:hypothetical protein